MAEAGSFFRETRLPQQRSVESVSFPAVLVPSRRPLGSPDNFLATLRSERVEPLVRATGPAVLLRGFPVWTAEDFDRVVEVFGYEELLYVGGVALRTNVVGAAKLGMKLEWTDDGVKTVMGLIPAVKWDESRGRKIWFNSIVAAYTGWKDTRNDPVKAATFGDGSPLPADIIDDCGKILEEECVAVPWRQGDILLIDNWAVLHSRRSFQPPRRVLASLCK